MADINAIKGSFDNLARPNRFHVTGFGLDRQLEFFAQSASLPASNLGTIEVPYQGRTIKVPGDRTFDEWTVTVREDNDASLRVAFEDWLNEVNGIISNQGINNVEDFKREGQVQQFDRAGNVILTYTIVGAWPSAVGAIDLSWDENDSVATFDVTIQYDYFTRA